MTKWVEETDVDQVSEESLKLCVEKRFNVDASKYELALIENS